jgi:hypothetical protein
LRAIHVRCAVLRQWRPLRVRAAGPPAACAPRPRMNRSRVGSPESVECGQAQTPPCQRHDTCGHRCRRFATSRRNPGAFQRARRPPSVNRCRRRRLPG